MKTKTIILTIVILFLIQVTVGQTDQKTIKYIQHNGLVSELAICFDCDLDTILETIKQRITKYPSDLETVYEKVKGDTLIEVISFDKNGQPDYSYYYNNLLKIHYTPIDSNNFILTIMNAHEMELKKWSISPKEFHVTDYDKNSSMCSYYAEIYPDSLTKIEFQKKWKNNRFQGGESKLYKKENTLWKLQETKEVNNFEWPKSTSKPINIDRIEGLDDLQKINLAHHIDSFEDKQYLIENTDTSVSFLPYNLKNNLKTGTYKIYEKIEKDFIKSKLLIDANVLEGKLHGVYNEYDQVHGKIKIYSVYNFGQLDGRKTIYFYDKRGNFNFKITELWNNGEFLGRVH